MKKTTSLKLSKQLAKYGALTAAIVGVNDINGQSIIYNDITDFTGGVGDIFQLDIDNNGTNDFQINSESGYFSSVNLFIEPLTASNEVLGSGGSTYAYPFALSNGAAISSGANSWYNNGFTSGFQSLNYGSCSFGNWCSITDGYLGLRFNISGNTHYGWARLDIDGGGSVWTVKDFAYHDTPDTPITAGQQTLSIEDSVLNDIKIVTLNKSIGLYNLTEATNYRLINMTGKQVMDGLTTSDDFVIEANSLATGIYILELTDSNTKATLKKKLVL
ncbi:T9SS type A sorting domain-containing protein [Winogradskyella undariae]|uniref:T9SS type A sorting domain-containing protein n=1 Tax=Winogradskyella undariae TaxID=1285465 RepID=UPI00156B3FA5|nr:T9SS type A sorting domain-containing protein [Winogradskyella undariae]NRR93276.1 T9SS type A sorting domain-containing protein [Winogradskyella undariae]